MNPPLPASLDRRRLLGCAALFGVAGPLLVACGAGDATESSPSPSSSQAPGAVIAAADVPVGGGVVVADQAIVVVQPTAGVFKAYSSVCTHQGNPVGSVADGKITCLFHGSQFSVDDGSNVAGPNGDAAGSIAPLPEIAITVTGGNVVRA